GLKFSVRAARSQKSEPVSSPKCQAIAARKYASGSSTGADRGTSSSEKSISAMDRSCRGPDDPSNRQAVNRVNREGFSYAVNGLQTHNFPGRHLPDSSDPPRSSRSGFATDCLGPGSHGPGRYAAALDL